MVDLVVLKAIQFYVCEQDITIYLEMVNGDEDNRIMWHGKVISLKFAYNC